MRGGILLPLTPEMGICDGEMALRADDILVAAIVEGGERLASAETAGAPAHGAFGGVERPIAVLQHFHRPGCS